MKSATIDNLIECLKKLPAVGQKTAERYVYHWLKSGKKEVNDLREALDSLLSTTKSCERCWDFSDQSPCKICQNEKRDKAKLCIVSEPQDMEAVEKIGEYDGVYFILRGLVDPIDMENQNTLKIQELWQRIKTDKDIKEIILAFNPDMAGETTMLFLKKELTAIDPQIKITRLARGLPLGSDIQYADDITLSNALQNRKNF